MSVAFDSCNSRILCVRCSNELNKNLYFSRSQFNFRNRHQFVDFTSCRRLFAAVDQRKSPVLTICSKKEADVAAFEAIFSSGKNVDKELTCVMKFGGSSVASAERMREAGEKAVSCGHCNVSEIEELAFIKELHLRTVKELGIDDAVISGHLEELELLLNGIARLKELTLRTQDKLVSFGECMSTRIFASYLNKIGTKAWQYDAFDIGFVTTDDFTNAEILEATYPAVASKLYSDWTNNRAIPVVTGFLGKGCKSGDITTLGRGGSDLTATTIGRALGLREIQVWKDVDGVLTCDPTIHPGAKPVPYLTFEEATELAYFGAQVLHPQSMRPAMDASIPVRVKNSYNPKAPGTLSSLERETCPRLCSPV
ncbi:Aspartokinase, chloroplastic [Sesamum alatum]|uniref:Aspartokinase n=1 Tax=Sesamum alatum TaxID=300844 RepID=A0AAE1XLC3_9LAMI|nr:Aspartokinase, chloroplastic [Sesamum alatum]